MNIVKKVMNKNNLPILLFVVLLLNYMPVFVNNFGIKTSQAVSTKHMMICFIIEAIILFIFLIRKIKLTKKFKIHVVVLAIVSILLLVAQFFNYKNDNFKVMDLANIACIVANIAMFFVAIIDLEIEEKHISGFFVGMVCIGIIASIVNVFTYNQEILKMLGIIEGSVKVHNIKSFFAHRNQFANFLYLTIIANMFLLFKSKKVLPKILLMITLFILGANLVTTASRTGLIATLVFMFLIFVFTNRIKIKNKIIISVIAVLVLTMVCIIAFNVMPEKIEKITEVISKVFIREKTIHNFTGRSKFWEIALETLSATPFTMIFGIGRFVGLELIEKYNVTQFHSFYIDTLVAGGIMELLYFMAIYFIVIRRVIKSNIEKQYKILYICTYISYALYCGFESLGRFSIGCGDTAYLIFLVSIPLLHANSSVVENNSETNNEKTHELNENINNDKSLSDENFQFKHLEIDEN